MPRGDAFIIADLEPSRSARRRRPARGQELDHHEHPLERRPRSARSNAASTCFMSSPTMRCAPTRSAQYLIWKKWPRWFVIRGDTPADQDYLAQVKRTAARFGGKIVEDKVYDLPPGARNLDLGPSADADADPHGDARQRPTTTWYGSSIATTISATTCSTAPTCRGRWWARKACRRSPGTSPTPSTAPCISRTRFRARQAPAGRARLHRLARLARARPIRRCSPARPRRPRSRPTCCPTHFKLEGFKGQAMSFRTWDHQMRQPIMLGGGTRVPVSTSPQEGFLHPTNRHRHARLRQPETKCKFK